MSKAIPSSFLVGSAPTLAATEAATSSIVVPAATGCATATGAGVICSLSPAFVVLSSVVLFDTSSLAWATAPAPKKILAPITTEAAPTLNFLIEYVSTFVPSFVFFKYWLFLPINFKHLPYNNLQIVYILIQKIIKQTTPLFFWKIKSIILIYLYYFLLFYLIIIV